jgi:hypothetical protein
MTLYIYVHPVFDFHKEKWVLNSGAKVWSYFMGIICKKDVFIVNFPISL